MKAKLTLLCLGLVAISMAGQNTVRFTRHQAVGDHDTFKISITGTAQMGDMDINLTETRTVKKVYDNGDADVETATTELKVSMGGNDFPVPLPPPTTIKMDKNGVPIGEQKGPGSGMNFSKYAAAFYDRDLKVGDTINVDQASPDGKEKTTGTVKLDSVANGEAKLTADLVTTLPDLDGPAKLHMDMFMDTASSKPNRMEATVSSMPLRQGMVLNNVKMTYERVK